MSLIQIADEFPFKQRWPGMVYLDSATTTQKPKYVIDAMNDHIEGYCATPSRGAYGIARHVTSKIETTRHLVGEFIGGVDANRVFFTGGATESANHCALSWGFRNLRHGDEILYCPDDHESTVSPWKRVRELLLGRGTSIEMVPFSVTGAGDYSLNDIRTKITSRTRVVVASFIHSIYGMRMGVEEIRRLLPEDVILCVDASQAVGHFPLDAQKFNPDFLYFSGHKMFGFPGTGVLAVSDRVLRGMSSFMVGAKPFDSFGLESGTPNTVGIISLGSAIEFIDSVGIENIRDHVSDLTIYGVRKLREVPGVTFAKGPGVCGCVEGYGVISYTLNDIPTTDANFAYDDAGICLRAGQHCSGNRSANDVIRASFHIYNSREDIDRLVWVTKEITGH